MLDFGFGSGNFDKFISKSGYDFIVENYDPNYSGSSFNIETDFDLVDWNKIDVIYSNQVFEHVKKFPYLLDVMYRKAKRGTHLVFSMPILGFVVKEFGELAYTLQIQDHKSLYIEGAFEELLKKSSWKAVYFKEEYLQKEYARLSKGSAH